MGCSPAACSSSTPRPGLRSRLTADGSCVETWTSLRNYSGWLTWPTSPSVRCGRSSPSPAVHRQPRQPPHRRAGRPGSHQGHRPVPTSKRAGPHRRDSPRADRSGITGAQRERAHHRGGGNRRPPPSHHGAARRGLDGIPASAAGQAGAALSATGSIRGRHGKPSTWHGSRQERGPHSTTARGTTVTGRTRSNMSSRVAASLTSRTTPCSRAPGVVTA